MVTGTVSATISGAIFNWANGQVGIEALRHNLASCSALILLGALRPEATGPIEDWLGAFLRGTRTVAPARRLD